MYISCSYHFKTEYLEKEEKAKKDFGIIMNIWEAKNTTSWCPLSTINGVNLEKTTTLRPTALIVDNAHIIIHSLNWIYVYILIILLFLAKPSNVTWSIYLRMTLWLTVIPLLSSFPIKFVFFLFFVLLRSSYFIYTQKAS